MTDAFGSTASRSSPAHLTSLHLAISSEWMVHYLNAGMHDDSAKRDEEARCMAAFEDDFATRHAKALAVIAARVGLDYFCIDCAETADGKLLVFEAGTGMIVHAMDSADVFPYKRVQMQKIFTAFSAMLAAAACGDARYLPIQ